MINIHCNSFTLNKIKTPGIITEYLKARRNANLKSHAKNSPIIIDLILWLQD